MSTVQHRVNLADHWEAVARAMPDRPALVHGDQITTWHAFERRAAAFAAVLAAHGVTAGDRVAIDLFNGNQYLEVWFGALKLRAVPANVNYRYSGEELAQLVDVMRPAVLVHHASLTDRVADVVAASDLALTVQVADDDRTITDDADYERLLAAHEPAPPIDRSPSDSFLAFTGGTTGLPKAVEHLSGPTTEKSVMLAGRLLAVPAAPADRPLIDWVVDLAARDLSPVCLPVSPLMHGTGLQMAALPALAAGGTVVTLTSRSLDAAELVRACAERAVTSVSLVGDVMARPLLDELERAPRALPDLRTITSAGTAWSPDVKQRLAGVLPDVVLLDVVGSTEGVTIGVQPSSAALGIPPEGTFSPTDGLMIIRADETEIPRDSDEVGGFFGPTPASGYWHDPDATASVFRLRGDVQHVIAGDLGHWNRDGTIQLIGRGSAVVNTGGEKVFPLEVESAMRTMPEVHDCIVVGLPDPTWGQQVAAVVELVPGASVGAGEIQARLRERLAGYKIPRTIQLAPVPRGANGKVLVPEAVALLKN
jgi:fatty-acyl-CoA synthase